MVKELEFAMKAEAEAEAEARAKAKARARAEARASARKSARESRKSGVDISRTTDGLSRRETNELRRGSGHFLYKNNTKSLSKNILGKSKRIYKVYGSKKEHVKHKGNLITVSDYKKLMK